MPCFSHFKIITYSKCICITAQEKHEFMDYQLYAIQDIIDTVINKLES